MAPTGDDSRDRRGQLPVCSTRSDDLDKRWIAWFECMEIGNGPNGVTVITGTAALHGLLAKVRPRPVLAPCSASVRT
jgi:hypothetical protein